MDTDILRTLDRVTDLPSLPEIVTKLMNAVEDPQSNASHVARIIADDPAVTAKVLRLANSAYYARTGQHEISSIPAAVVRMGLREIKNIVLTLSAYDLFATRNSLIDLKGFWRHSVTVAITTKYLHDFARDGYAAAPSEKDTYHVAGLLHDIGILIVNQYFRDRFQLVLREMASGKMTYPQAEQTVLGVDHATIGGYIARYWRLSDEIVAGIENHHHPEQAPEPVRRIARILNLANHLCMVRGQPFPESQETDDEQTHLQSLKALEIPVKHLSEIMDIVEEEAARSEVLVALV